MSIKVILENVTCHINSEYVIEKGKLTLVKGASGIGKSSIFQAISWCLYGKIKGLCNHNASRYVVTLIFEEYTITRIGKKNKLLTITFPNGAHFEDKVAQPLIDKIFGPEDIWMSSCYIEQDNRSPLLTGTNNERMDILNKLSFWEDNPDEILDRIDIEIKTQQNDFLVDQSNYNAEYNLFTNQINQKPIEVTPYQTKDQINALDSQIKSVSEEVILLNEEYQKQLRLAGSVDTLRNSLKIASNKLNEYSVIDSSPARISELEDQIKDNELKIQLLSHSTSSDNHLIRDKLKAKINEILGAMQTENMIKQNIVYHEQLVFKCDEEYKNLQESVKIKKEILNTHGSTGPDTSLSKNLTRSDLQKAIEQENLRKESINFCKMCNIEYTTEFINQATVATQNKIDEINLYKSDANILFNINTIRSKINSLGTLADVNEAIIESLEKRYSNGVLSQGLLNCPHCKKSIRYHNGSLHAEDGNIVSSEELEEIKKELSSLRMNKEKCTLKINYDKQIEQLSSLLKTNGVSHPNFVEDEMKYKQLLSILQRIRFIPEPTISSETLIKVLDYYESVSKLDSYNLDQKKSHRSILIDLNNKLSQIPTNLAELLSLTKSELSFIENKLNESQNIYQKEILDLNARVKNLVVQRNKLCSIASEVTFLQKEIGSVGYQIFDIESKIDATLSQKIKDKALLVENLKLLKEKATYTLEMTSRFEYLTARHKSITERNIALSDLYLLKQTAFDMECDHLQSTVDSINQSMNSVLEEIFDKPIKVILKLYKENKTNHKVKAKVNLNIYYNGNDYDSISKLSGGEKDRVSFSLTLALARINGSPILLLDEVYRSLDETIRGRCLDCIRSFFGDTKTIICISHEDVEGHYDNIINIS